MNFTILYRFCLPGGKADDTLSPSLPGGRGSRLQLHPRSPWIWGILDFRSFRVKLMLGLYYHPRAARFWRHFHFSVLLAKLLAENSDSKPDAENALSLLCLPRLSCYPWLPETDRHDSLSGTLQHRLEIR